MRNEADRWLLQSLQSLSGLDYIAVYDDQSDDDSIDIAKSVRNTVVGRRPDGVPSFAEDESQFREAAWRFMEKSLFPGPRDWILCVDADEILTTHDQHEEEPADLLRELALHGPWQGHPCATLRVPEVFGFGELGVPQIRIDGFWGNITARRFVNFQRGGRFSPREEGGGSVPSFADKEDWIVERIVLLHLGYAREEDRQAKYQRYSAGRGHNPKHIQSILTRPRLKTWTGPFLDLGL